MPIPRNHPIDHPFLDVLNRVVLQRNPKATAAARADVRQTLQFFEVPHILKPLLRDIFPIGLDRRPSQESFDSLMRTPVADGVQISHDTKVRGTLAQLLTGPHALEPVYAEVLQWQTALLQSKCNTPARERQWLLPLAKAQNEVEHQGFRLCALHPALAMLQLSETF